MTTIFWAGDSTVQTNSILTYPQTGIGQVFDRYVKRDGVRIENHARNGRSTKSFLDEGLLMPIYDRMTRGDFLFVQFGHNDEKQDDPARYAAPFGEYSENLERFVNAARNKGAYPVLITPLTRRLWRDPNAPFRHDQHAQAVRETAARLKAALVDLCRMSEELVDAIPEEESRSSYMNLPRGVYPAFPEGLCDNTHLSPKGALAFGGLIARSLHALGGEYAALLFEGYDQWRGEGMR